MADAAPARPDLAAVLAVLAGTEPDAWAFDRRSVVRVTAGGVGWTPPGVGWFSDEYPWTITDPAAAWEALVARGVLPPELGPGADPLRRRWCPPRNVCAVEDPPATGRARAAVYTDVPPDLAALVAWASLGADAIVRAEALVREVVRGLAPFGAPQPERVAWRVAPPETRVAARWIWRSTGGRSSECCIHEDGTTGGSPHFVLSPRLADYPRASRALCRAGYSLHSLTDHAVVVSVPPIGGGP